MEEDGLDNNELFEGYLDQLFYGGVSTYSLGNFDSYNWETEQESNLYIALKEKLTQIGDGTESNTKFSFTDITFDVECTPGGIIEDEIEEFLKNKISNVMDAILADCPYELYWFNKSKGYSYTCAYSGLGNDKYQISNLQFTFSVDKNYAQSGNPDTNLVDGGQVQRAQAAKAEADKIVDKYKLLGDYDKLSAYMTEICDLNVYNDDAAASDSKTIGIDPWQLVYVFDGDPATNVVCEGYSKAFAYLFEKSTFENDIKCYIVTGTLGGDSSAAGGHMWNIVTMEDGKSYIVDVTNCDGNSIGNPDLLFLAGLPGSVDGGYTFTRDSQNVYYFKYDEETKNLYPGKVLELSDKNYVKKTDQEELTITNIPDKTYGDESFKLSVTGGSGDGAVTYSVPENNGVLSIEGDTASIMGAGTVEITAIKAGDDKYNSAKAIYTLEIAKKNLIPSINGEVIKYYDGTTSIENADGNTLSIGLDGLLDKDTGKVEASAEFAYKDAGIGTEKEITAINIVLSGDSANNYILSSVTAAANVGTIKESRNDQQQLVITEVTGKVYGDGDFGLSVTGGSGDGVVTYSVPENNGVLSIDGSIASIIGTGKVVVTAVKAGNDEYNPAQATYELEVAKRTLIPSISGEVTKKYDETTSVDQATANTLAIKLEGVLEKDIPDISATATYLYESADVGDNKKVIATNIILSGNVSDNYILSIDTVYANIGKIEPSNTSGDTTGGDTTGGNTTGGSTTGGGTTGGNTTGGGTTGGNTTGGGTTGGNTTGGNTTGGGTTVWSTGGAPSTPAPSTPAPGTSVPSTPVPDASVTNVPVQDTTKTDTVTNPDGSTTITKTEIDDTGKVTQVTKITTEQKEDGTTVKTEIVTSGDNRVTTTITTTNTDGSAKEVVSETGINSKNKEIQVTTTTNIGADGLIAGVTKKTVIENIAYGTTAVVIMEMSGDKVDAAEASVSKIADTGNKANLSKDVTDQITEAAGEVNVKITMTVKDTSGKVKYKVKADTADLAAGNELYIYQLNTKTGEYTMVNSKTYKVSDSGNIQVSMKKNKTYELVSGEKNNKIIKDIKKTVTVKKKSVNVKKGNKIQFGLNSKLNIANVKNITYTSSKKSIAAVSSKGKITAKKPGTVVVKAKVVLKNGTWKTISMKIKVK